MTALVLGIDPGLAGAVGALTLAGDYVGVADLPVARDGKLSWIDGGELSRVLHDLRDGRRVLRVFVERVQAMPAQGRSSGFNFGVGFGAILGALQVLQLPTELVTPSAWKSAMKLGADKREALTRARMRFPEAPLDRVRDDGRAEALLLAAYGVGQLGRAAA